MVFLSTAGVAIGLGPLSFVPFTRLLEYAGWQAEEQFIKYDRCFLLFLKAVCSWNYTKIKSR